VAGRASSFMKYCINTTFIAGENETLPWGNHGATSPIEEGQRPGP
jgi:hypothetical protein